MEDKAMLGSNLSAMRVLRSDGRATYETAARLCANTSLWNLRAKNPMPKHASAKKSDRLLRYFLTHFTFDDYFMRPVRKPITYRVSGNLIRNAFMPAFAIKLRADDH